MAAPKRCRFDRRSAAAGARTPLPLPADVVLEILSWLPAKFLGRCRCVCTWWRALISEPAFLAAQRSRASPLLVAAAHTDCGTTSVRIMDTDGDVVRLVDVGGLWMLRASLDGLVLLTCRHVDDPRGVISIMDLATGGTILSCPGPDADAADHVATSFGFGRAARSGSGTLKVIRLVSRSFLFGNDRLVCEVLTLPVAGGSAWRRTGSPPSKVCYSYDYDDGVAVNCVLHFLSIWHDGILCFDLESEEWTVISGPYGVVRRKKEISLAELNGALCVAHVNRHTDAVDLWLLADIDKDVWVKEYTIMVDHVVVDLVPLTTARICYAEGQKPSA